MIVSPLTGSSDVSLLRSIPAAEIIGLWQYSTGLDITDELKGHSHIELYQCNSTGVKFFSPNDVYGSDALYEKLSKDDKYYQHSSWEHHTAARDLERSEAVLEVGCGFGAFMLLLQKDYGIQSRGIEINENAVSEATTNGLQVERAELCEYAQRHAREYDAVCAFQVLEHVPNPGVFLQACVDLIKPGGKLILAVPNDDSFIALDERNPRNLPPHHMTRWGKRALRAVAGMYNLKVLQLCAEPLSLEQTEYYARVKVAAGPKSRLGRGLTHRIMRRVILPILRRSQVARGCVSGHTVYACLQKG